MKTYVLTVSRYFPTTHKRKGEHTYFIPKIELALGQVNKTCSDCFLNGGTSEMCKSCFITHGENWPKLHTIRANYDLWKKRIDEVQEGKAILSVRYWSGKPYNSKQVTICNLTKDDGVGIQKILFDDYLYSCLIEDKRFGDMWKLSQNDGLSDEDFEEWFKKYDFRKPMAIIHFTNFRY